MKKLLNQMLAHACPSALNSVNPALKLFVIGLHCYNAWIIAEYLGDYQYKIEEFVIIPDYERERGIKLAQKYGIG